MFAVIFEVNPHQDQFDDYLDIAALLRPELEKIEGFISIERFTSLTTQGKILSLSFWQNEDAIKTWRDHVEHRIAQQKGRYEIFQDYRLRVAAVVRDYGMFERDQAPQKLPPIERK